MGDKVVVTESEMGTGYEADRGDDAAWLELHDLLLDEWYAIYQEVRTRKGFPVGEKVILPVKVITNMTCMHDCPCLEDAELMFAVPGHTEGSRWDNLRLVAVCIPCLQGTGARPMEASDAPVQ